MNDPTEGLLEIRLGTPSDFLKIAESLTRMGFQGELGGKTIFQQAHILHKRGRYFIVHWKELFRLDGVDRGFQEEDALVRNSLAKMLEEWGLCTVVAPEVPEADRSSLRVIKFADKERWQLVAHYAIGKRK